MKLGLHWVCSRSRYRAAYLGRLKLGGGPDGLAGRQEAGLELKAARSEPAGVRGEQWTELARCCIGRRRRRWCASSSVRVYIQVSQVKETRYGFMASPGDG